MSSHSGYSARDFHNASTILRAALHLHTRAPRSAQAGPEPRPFLTVSREPGAAGRSFARRLVERLNETPNADWSCWDQELVEKVSAEHDIEKSIVEMMEDRRYTWLTDLLENLVSPSDSRHHPDEFKVYRRVAITIRALANGGHSVIVGRGGTFLTAGQQGGIHVRIVAPLAHRVAHTAERDGLSQKQAAEKVAQTERNREAFYHRHWPGRPVGAEAFTITLNSAQLTTEEMVDCLLPLIHSRDHSLGRRPPELTVISGALQDMPRVAQGGGV